MTTNTCANRKQSAEGWIQERGSVLVLSDSPRSISVPHEKRSLRPTRSQDGADETVLCLQPDLPLAKGLSSSTITAWANVWRPLGGALFQPNWSWTVSLGPFSSVGCRFSSSSSSSSSSRTGEVNEPVAALLFRCFGACGRTNQRQVSQSHFNGFRCALKIKAPNALYLYSN